MCAATGAQQGERIHTLHNTLAQLILRLTTVDQQTDGGNAGSERGAQAVLRQRVVGVGVGVAGNPWARVRHLRHRRCKTSPLRSLQVGGDVEGTTPPPSLYCSFARTAP